MGTATPRSHEVLRAEAEALVKRAGHSDCIAKVNPSDTATASAPELMHELRVHQVELQAQNDELLRIQSEVTKSRDRYCDLFDSAPVGYLILDSNGKTVAVNLAAAGLLGYERDELVGRQLQSLVSAEEADKVHRLYRDVLVGKRNQSCELEIPLPGEASTFIHVQCLLSMPVDGQDLSIRMTLTDVTSLKETEARRAELELRLQLKQRLASLGVLAGGIAHDFNNLLFGMITHADLLMQSEPTPSQQESIHQIRSAATQSASLCSQMLDFAGNQHLEKSVFKLADVVDEMRDLLSPTFKTTKVNLAFHHSPDLPWSEGDVTRIRQVVMNIILNAVEAIGDGEGTVSVATGLVVVDSNYPPAMQIQDELSGGEYVFLDVIDSGCGIERKALEKVFEPFFTTKFTGRGLGLASVLGIVRSHGGAVNMKSTPGRGTSVRVLLPAISQPLIGNSKAGVDPADADVRCTVLLVDDEELVRVAIKAKLQRKGYSVLTASDGAAALEALKGHDARIDVVVLDLTMPGLSTAKICQSLHDIVPELPVLLMSGFSEEESLSRCDYTNIAGFVAKPMGDICTAISQLFTPADS